MRKLLLAIAIMLCSGISAQNTDTWTNYMIDNVGTLSIPNTMELRDGESATGKFIDNAVQYKIIQFGGTNATKRIVFQPIGLNSGDPKLVNAATDKYARIIIDIYSANGITQSDIDNISAADIKDLNSFYYENYMASVQAMGKSVDQFQWFPLKRAKYAGRNALVMHFKRPGIDGLVDVTEYHFYIRGQEVCFIISYRESAKSFYADDFCKIMYTLKFK